ncbi:MAG: putative quinol monooxygenase [Nannocystaceae bacterium]|nr:antibiotic biosynthesis monooxygenase [Myxococcales bacterium]
MNEAAETVHVLVDLQIKPGTTARALEIFAQAAAPTRAEPGCVRYELCQSQDDERRFVLVEEWRSQAALDEHLTKPYIRTMGAALPEVVAAPLGIRFLREVPR